DMPKNPAYFSRNLAKFTKAAPQWCRDQHADTIKRLEQAGELFSKTSEENGTPLVFTLPAPAGRTASSGTSRLGIVVSGVSSTYLQELRQRYPERFADVSILKLGVVNPL